jgi:hypothetical protein
MSISNHSAAALVLAYLDGRSMDDWLLGAVVWMADRRLASGMTPVLDQRLRMDIDSQAQAPASASTPTCITAQHAAAMSTPA